MRDARTSIEEHANAFRDGQEVKCQYFALCENPATRLLDAGPLGEVPTCDRCAGRIAQLERT